MALLCVSGRLGKSALTFMNKLRATGTLESERTYDVAQARAQEVVNTHISLPAVD
jgi:hypothetical protein